MIGLGEDAPFGLDLASLGEQVDALARSARSLTRPGRDELLLAVPWAEASDRLRDLAAHDVCGPVRVRAVTVDGALHVTVAAYNGRNRGAVLATSPASDDADPGSRGLGGWDYYPGD